MTKEQFLSAIGDIDDKFIKEITNAPDILDKPQENYFDDEKPQVVYLTNEHIPFWKIAVSAAAAVCVLTVGVFAMAKLHGIQSVTPNDSTAENSSYSQTETSSKPDKFDTVLTNGNDFSYITPNWYYHTDAFEKNDDENYAVVYVYCRNISEENPLFIAVQKYRDGNPVYIGNLTVTDDHPRTYRIDYEEEVKRGDELFLYITTKTDEDARVDGKWLP